MWAGWCWAHIQSVQTKRGKPWFVLHGTKQPKAPPTFISHPESIYLWFSFRCLFSCCPNWSTSSCCDATSCGSTRCCGNHSRLCSHGRSRCGLLQCSLLIIRRITQSEQLNLFLWLWRKLRSWWHHSDIIRPVLTWAWPQKTYNSASTS